MNLQNLQEIKIDIVSGKMPYYVYLLFKPDGTPFYVGKGKSNRISAHEAETRYYLNGRKWTGINTFKINTISSIWDSGEIVRYQIDSWHKTSESAGARELELVVEYGRRILNTGTLTNIRDGGDLMTEQDRKLFGEKIRQYYIDHPEARELVSERMLQYYIDHPEARELVSERIRQYYIDHPEARERMSDVLSNYCIEHPEFVENLQLKKNEWIESNPEEYLATKEKLFKIHTSEEYRAKVSRIMRDYFFNNPDELDRLKSQGASYFENNPEAIERARQNSIRNNTSQKLIDWYSSDDPEIELARRKKWDNHSDYLKQWHSTDRGKEVTKVAAKKRNKKIRTDEHRDLMSRRTSEYIAKNPEADRLRREKAKATNMIKRMERQKKLLVIQEELYSSGKISKKYDYINSKVLYVWKKRGFVQDSDLHI